MIRQVKNKENKDNSGSLAMAVFVGILFALLVYPHLKPIFDNLMEVISAGIKGGR